MVDNNVTSSDIDSKDSFLNAVVVSVETFKNDGSGKCKIEDPDIAKLAIPSASSTVTESQAATDSLEFEDESESISLISASGRIRRISANNIPSNKKALNVIQRLKSEIAILNNELEKTNIIDITLLEEKLRKSMQEINRLKISNIELRNRNQLLQSELYELKYHNIKPKQNKKNNEVATVRTLETKSRVYMRNKYDQKLPYSSDESDYQDTNDIISSPTTTQNLLSSFVKNEPEDDNHSLTRSVIETSDGNIDKDSNTNLVAASYQDIEINEVRKHP